MPTLSATQVAILHRLAAKAMDHPASVSMIAEQIKTPRGKARHRARLLNHTTEIRWLRRSYLVTYMIETGHPEGKSYRHLRIQPASPADPLLSSDQTWLFAQVVGFEGVIEDCSLWQEIAADRGTAINIAQEIGMGRNGRGP